MRPGPGWDVAVVGSGFGGAVTAARLAQGGLRVLVLERGPWWGSNHDGDRSDAAVRQLPRGLWSSRNVLRSIHFAAPLHRSVTVNNAGLYAVHRFRRITVLTGSGVGGGSHVYASIQREPADRYWEWLPEELDAPSMKPYYAAVRAMQRPSPDPALATGTRPAVAAARRLGLPIETPDLAVSWTGDQACQACGLCLLGCDVGAKTTLDQTYIPAALEAGATLWPRCEVGTIGAAEGGGYLLTGTDHRNGSRFVVRAPRLILAAGTLSTTRLLFEARDRLRSLPRISPALGTRFSGNADYTAVVPHRRRPEPRPQALVAAAFEDQRSSGYLLDTSLPRVAGPLGRLAARGSILVGMAAEQSTARLTYAAGRWDTDLQRRPGDPYDRFDEVFGQIAVDDPGKERGRVLPGPRRLVSAHPLGGAPMGTDPTNGVVSHTGEVFGHPGLYVADGAQVPAAPGVPPSLTIAALAERQAALILEDS